MEYSSLAITDTINTNIGVYTDGLNTTTLTSIALRDGGYYATVSKVLAGTGATSVNLFQITGAVRVKSIYGQITAKTTLANMTAAHFNLYDSTASVEITKSDGVLSGLAVGTTVAKLAVNTTTAVVLNNAAGAYSDLPLYPFIVVQKTAANTFIQWKYSTTDNPIAATMTFHIVYEPIGTGTLVAV